MTSILRWDPLRDLEDFQARLSSAFAPVASEPTPWVPAVDIEEDDKEFLFKVDLPDLRKEDIQVKFDAGVLTISGERKLANPEGQRKLHRVERRYGAFARSFELPEDTDVEGIHAEFTNGTLHVHLPKTERAKPKVIDVKVN